MSAAIKDLVEKSLRATTADRAVVLTNLVRPEVSNADEQARFEMAGDFVQVFNRMGIESVLLAVPDSGSHNAPLPEHGHIDGRLVNLVAEIHTRTIAIAPTAHSLTAPLAAIIKSHTPPSLRAITMPGIRRRSLLTALQADQQEIARRAAILKPLLDAAIAAKVVFSTGDEMTFDLHGSVAAVDDGDCSRPGQIINAPFGEVYAVPCERSSLSEGILPLAADGGVAKLHVEQNRIVAVSGDNAFANSWARFFAEDPARANIAEFGLGLNDRAVVIPGEGYILEEEKAEGFHWAFGRSDHFGGIIGPDSFASPKHCVHQDVVYNRDTPIGVSRVELHFSEANMQTIMLNNRYCIF